MRAKGTESVSDTDVPSFLQKPKRRMPEGEAAIIEAARWLVQNRADLRARRDPVVPTLKQRFRISTKQAIEAIRHANGVEQRDR